MTQDEAQRRRWTFYEAVKFAAQNKVMYTKITLESKGVDSPLIHHQDTICRVAVVRSSLRRIGPYASVVAPWCLASDASW